MTKNQKMLLGLGAVAVGGYLFYKYAIKSKNMVGATGTSIPKTQWITNCGTCREYCSKAPDKMYCCKVNCSPSCCTVTNFPK